MKITAIDIYQLGEPGDGKEKPPLRPVVVRLETDEGINGFGELGLAYGAGSSAGFGMLKDLASYVLGADPRNVESLWEKLFRKTFWGMGGGPVVYGGISAIDTACYDIKAKALDIPVYHLLGGKTRDRLRTYASQIQRVSILSNENNSADFVVEYSPLISGTLRLPDGKPAPHTIIKFIGYNETIVFTDEAGKYSVMLGSGIYDIYSEYSAGSEVYAVMDRVLLDNQIETDLILGFGTKVSGVVTDGDGIPGRNVLVLFEDLSTGF